MTVRRRLAGLIVALVVAAEALAPGQAGAQAACGFTLGFRALRDQIAEVVGACLEDERFNPANGNAEQRTTGGLLVWRKADNWTAFTDGTRTWLNGPQGLAVRLNDELFPWEARPPLNPLPAEVASAPPAPAEPQSADVPASPSPTPVPTAARPAEAPAQPVVQVDDRLRSAWRELIDLKGQGGFFRDIVLEHAVRLTVGTVPKSAFAVFRIRENTVTVGEQVAGEDARALAAVLAHEITHAAQTAEGRFAHDDDSCVQLEVEAFVKQAKVWDAFWKNPPQRTNLERNLTVILGVYRKSGESGIRKVVINTPGYKRLCDL